VQRQAAQRRHHVADPRFAARMHGGGEALHESVHLQVEDARELDVDGDVAEGDDCAGAMLLQMTFGTSTPIMQLRVTIAARRASSQPSVPAGRIGSTR